MNASCPFCNEPGLHLKRVREELLGVALGWYDAEVCQNCGEAFFTAGGVKLIEARARELGLWGLASKVKVTRSGDSFVIRIPSALARRLKLRSGQGVFLTPEQGNRFVLDLP